MNRQARTAQAQETLHILESGSYQTPSGRSVRIAEWLREAVTQSRLYRPNDFPAAPLPAEDAPRFQTQNEVTGETTLEATARLARLDTSQQPLCLNFASARNPGGGFLSGSLAQEESLAMASGLYACQQANFEMYEFNRRQNTCLYSDHMIYSPGVPVFRGDNGRLLDEPYRVAIITAPAVNAGVVRQQEPQNISRIRSTMAVRLQKVLWIAQRNGHRTLILGAWGCGVFGNEPREVADVFAETLHENGPFAGCFERVVYAVFDRSPSREVLAAFKQRLAR